MSTNAALAGQDLIRCPIRPATSHQLPTSKGGKWEVEAEGGKFSRLEWPLLWYWPDMSRDSAKKDAQRWVDGLNLATKSLRGETIDLSEQAKSLKFEAHYRAMVITEARRILKKRGVNVRISGE